MSSSANEANIKFSASLKFFSFQYCLSFLSHAPLGPLTLNTHTLTHMHTRSHTDAHTHTQSLSLTHSHTLSGCLTPAHSPSFILSLSPFITITQYDSQSLSFKHLGSLYQYTLTLLSNTQTHSNKLRFSTTHTHSCALTDTRTHAYANTLLGSHTR